MGRAFDTITDAMAEFIRAQHVFFVATAPSDGGRVNLSPKGYDSFTVIDDRRVAYLDLTGSGAETIAHVNDNGRITFMFCAFDGKPNIVRLYGRARVLLPGGAEFADLLGRFGPRPGARAIVAADIDRTSMSCGYAVPFMDFVSERTTLADWAEGKSDAELDDYRAQKNARSIDGLPALAETP